MQGRLWGTGYTEDLQDDPRDYYAIALMAGQTVTIDGYMGHVNTPGGASMYPVMGIALQDEQTNYLASVGLETVEDAGWDSRGTTQKALVFTAHQGGHLLPGGGPVRQCNGHEPR